MVMPMYQHRRGFTLIEMMVTVVIIGILSAIAYPAYTEQVAKGRRADARVRLVAAQQWMERYYTERYSYASTGETTQNADFGNQTNFVTSPPASEGAAMYRLGVVVNGTGYTITATRQSGSAMANDACGDLTLTHDGTRSVTNWGGRYAGVAAAVAACWH
ncbi:MAG: hypothetical protein RLZZ369_2320 [Pseudomonadota bacterium]|jgi:type IV pilus assembly protein PilE